MNRLAPKARTSQALRLARAAAGMPTDTVAAVCGLSDQALRKHLRNLPARGRCAATVAALAAAQRLPEPPQRAVVAHRACPPPAMRAARPTDLEAVNAAKGSASWALAHNPFRGASMELYAFACTSGLHRSVIVALASARDYFHRTSIAYNPLCPPPILQQLAHDPSPGVRDTAAHTLRRCCCDEPSQQTCGIVDHMQESLESADKLFESVRFPIQMESSSLRRLTT